MKLTYLTASLLLVVAEAFRARPPSRRQDPVFTKLPQAVLAAALLLAPPPAIGISGGGVDYASSDISNKDFSKQDLSNKDFSGALAINANFQGAVLKGSRFFKTNVKDADFTGADLTGVAMEQAQLDGTNLGNAVLEGVYFTGATLDQAGNIKGADFTDAVISERISRALCEREDASGTNPKTGIDTRESLFCR